MKENKLPGSLSSRRQDQEWGSPQTLCYLRASIGAPASWLGQGLQIVPTLEKLGTSGPQGTAASELTYLPLGCRLVTVGELVGTSVVTGSVNVVVEVVADTVVAAWHTEQITCHPACLAPVALHVALSLEAWGLPWFRSLELGHGKGPIGPWTTPVSSASGRLRASEGGSVGTGPRGTWSRPWKGEGAQDCLRSRAAGVQLKVRHSCCM